MQTKRTEKCKYFDEEKKRKLNIFIWNQKNNFVYFWRIKIKIIMLDVGSNKNLLFCLEFLIVSIGFIIGNGMHILFFKLLCRSTYHNMS